MKWIAGLLLLMMVTEGWSQEGVMPGKREAKEVQKIWGSDIVFERIYISDMRQVDSSKVSDSDRIYSISSGAGRSGYLFTSSAMGRFEYFDYGVIYSDDLKLLKVFVTRYRSSHGGAICSKGWLKQFEDYEGGPLRIGQEIDAIAGATISANSITRDIARGRQLVITLTD